MSDEPPRGLAHLLAEARPRAILALGPVADRPFRDHQAACPDCRVEHIPQVPGLEVLNGRGRYDLAFVEGVLEALDKGTGERLIARLRDVHAPRVLLGVEADNAPGWRPHDFYAHGFVRLTDATGPDGTRRVLYGFDLATYKTTPDWLNSRHWAHPELFDRSWW